ncbi:hypothetical protein J437_LFUL016343 [Ladona fulva]|uniref:Uncharacterized protein n=1 Tax=Ladona fulva TaxID=123851 RepID=A0A8K0KS73_LADFU|nr:hypothetical protein J437_LFUL016343 [Ladona fulva]
MTAKSAELLDSLERRKLRRIYGPVNSEGIWRIRWNHKIYELPPMTHNNQLHRQRNMPVSASVEFYFEDEDDGDEDKVDDEDED